MQSSLAVVLACLACLWLGWYLRDLRQSVHLVWDDLLNAIKKQHTPLEEPRSSIVEPKVETPGERAKREQEELLERLNASGNQTR